MCSLCPAVCSKPNGEKVPPFLVDLHLPWAGSFLKSFSLFIPAQFLRWPCLVISREKKEGGSGLSPAFCARLDSRALCLPCRKQENSATPILTPWRMAPHRKNSLPATHSLTPMVSNRLLLFLAVEIPKKPEATGSAGRCNSGEGRSTDPHPLICCFFTPLSTAWLRGICYGCWEDFTLARWPAFSSLPHTQGVLQAAAFGNCCSQPAHTAPTGPIFGPAGVVSLPGFQNRTQDHTAPSFFFCSKNEFTPPPKGGGAGALSCSA